MIKDELELLHYLECKSRPVLLKEILESFGSSGKELLDESLKHRKINSSKSKIDKEGNESELFWLNQGIGHDEENEIDALNEILLDLQLRIDQVESELEALSKQEK